MPMEYKFRYTDLIMFHKIYHDRSVVKLPYYLTAVTNSDRSRLRSTIRQPQRFSEFESSGIPDLNQRRNNRFDRLSLKSSVEAKARCFKGSFFYRTHTKWNDLPTELKEEIDSDVFGVKLKRHLWDIMIDPD